METFHGVHAIRVRLDKADIVDMVSQVTSLGGLLDIPEQPASEEDIAGIQEDAMEALPEDMVIETWIALDGSYPVRTVITLTIPAGDEGMLVGMFPPSSSVRLQMDITDPDAEADIEPPANIPTPETPVR